MPIKMLRVGNTITVIIFMWYCNHPTQIESVSCYKLNRDTIIRTLISKNFAYVSHLKSNPKI